MASPRLAPKIKISIHKKKPVMSARPALDGEDWVPSKYAYKPSASGSVYDPNDIPKPQPETLKAEIMNLMKDEKRARYLLGQKLELLQKERARGRNGTFLKDLRELHIADSKAYRLIKFYRRVQAYITVKRAEDTKLATKWAKDGIQDVNDFERGLLSDKADEHLASINVMGDMEREKVKQAQATRAAQPSRFKLTLPFSDAQKKQFKKAWESLEESTRVSIVFKAVMRAAKN
ncbi:MAG TPA: hypothetical protein VGM18_14045 [Candidatus Sulfotelmatobacter sp.]|jgi:hypothetical protein